MINTANNEQQLEILHTKAHPVEFPLSKENVAFVEKLYKEVKAVDPPPLGLAANQIAESADHIPSMFLALFDYETKEIEDDEGNKKEEFDTSKPIFQLFINPQLKLSGGQVKNIEGCLSIPGKLQPIKRYRNATITYNDIQGNKFTVKINGKETMLSFIVQHEYDHLQGLLITDPRLKKHGFRL